MFEDEFTEIQTDMIDICNEYSCGVADKVFVYAANEGLNNCLYKCSKLNNAGLQTEFDVSIDCQRQVLKVLNDNVKKIQTLCEKYNQPIPKLMKLVYEPKTKKINADYKYDNQTTDDVSVFDNYNSWFEEEKTKLENQNKA